MMTRFQLKCIMMTFMFSRRQSPALLVLPFPEVLHAQDPLVEATPLGHEQRLVRELAEDAEEDAEQASAAHSECWASAQESSRHLLAYSRHPSLHEISERWLQNRLRSERYQSFAETSQDRTVR